MKHTGIIEKFHVIINSCPTDSPRWYLFRIRGVDKWFYSDSPKVAKAAEGDWISIRPMSSSEDTLRFNGEMLPITYLIDVRIIQDRAGTIIDFHKNRRFVTSDFNPAVPRGPMSIPVQETLFGI